MNLKNWQHVITKVAEEHGFSWRKDVRKTLKKQIVDLLRKYVYDYDLLAEHIEPRLEKILETVPQDIDTVLLRLHSEITEASEALRDDKTEEFAEELADIFIRLANCAEVMGIDLDKEVAKKHRYNKTRPKLHGRMRK